MEKLKIHLENCYGIGQLDHEFDFSGERRIYSIYAPNGTMKTSFARVFRDIIEDQKSRDLVYQDVETVREVERDDEDKEIEAKSVFVVGPHKNTEFEPKSISTLLANKKLKDDYKEAHRKINAKKDELVESLKGPSGLKNKDIENEISNLFMFKEGEFFLALDSIATRVRGASKGLSDVVYNKIFSEKTEKLLDNPNIQEEISKYIEKYNSLIDESRYFSRGIFNHYNAETIAKNLETNGFFDANHSVVFTSSKDNKKEVIDTKKKLIAAINQEKDAILKDEDLQKAFKKIDEKLKNEELRQFREYLSTHEKIIPLLDNLRSFKSDLWISYIQDNKDIYESLIKLHEEVVVRIAEIVAEANKETPKWRRVIKIYNDRFSVPFIVKIKNQSDAILRDETPSIAFEYSRAGNRKSVSEDVLRNVLSAGESRALYILNIIFEVEARKETNQETLFIIDDISDSFDYKNKYAILEYLDDISKEDNFYQIILTHNFDFYRTMNERLDMPSNKNQGSANLHVVRTEEQEISLHEDKYSQNPFHEWRKNLGEDANQLIAFIPFARNIAQFSGDKNKNKLIPYLHFKKDTPNLTVNSLQEIFKDIFKDFQDLNLPKGEQTIISLIYETAEDICSSGEGETVDLERKIVLSIAIRLKTEQFIVDKLGGHSAIPKIKKDQTRVLVEKYKKEIPEPSHARILDEVNLMTPQNIHINSFMYEPIIDMSIDRLKKLYIKICDMGKDE